MGSSCNPPASKSKLARGNRPALDGQYKHRAQMARAGALTTSGFPSASVITSRPKSRFPTSEILTYMIPISATVLEASVQIAGGRETMQWCVFVAVAKSDED